MLHILQVGDVLVSPDILTVKFCCDLAKCKGRCCIEGDAGAPVTLEEISLMEENVDSVWADLSASAQAVIDKQGVAYSDADGDLVTSIVGGRDCVFTCYNDVKDASDGHIISNCCLCAFDCAFRKGELSWQKPISCALYPIREKRFASGLVGINYHSWEICRDAVTLGKKLNLPLYQFLKEPLIRRFGIEWYQELCAIADDLMAKGMI